jgi:hypothetical protein
LRVVAFTFGDESAAFPPGINTLKKALVLLALKANFVGFRIVSKPNGKKCSFFMVLYAMFVTFFATKAA